MQNRLTNPPVYFLVLATLFQPTFRGAEHLTRAGKRSSLDYLGTLFDPLSPDRFQRRVTRLTRTSNELVLGTQSKVKKKRKRKKKQKKTNTNAQRLLEDIAVTCCDGRRDPGTYESVGLMRPRFVQMQRRGTVASANTSAVIEKIIQIHYDLLLSGSFELPGFEERSMDERAEGSGEGLDLRDIASHG